jgi:hypothetical protein
MIKLIIKEFVLSLIIFLIGYIVFNSFGLTIKSKWIFLSLILFFLFSFGSVFFNVLKQKGVEWLGLAFAGITFLNQLILLILLFVFLEPQEQNHRIVAKVGIVAYLTFLGIDTYWKLKWLFSDKKM